MQNFFLIHKSPIDQMLAHLPNCVSVHPNIVKAFTRLEPLTKAKFIEVAHKYEIPEPNFDDELTTFKTKRDKHGHIYIGQFSYETEEKHGIIRKFSANGCNLSD